MTIAQGWPGTCKSQASVEIQGHLEIQSLGQYRDQLSAFEPLKSRVDVKCGSKVFIAKQETSFHRRKMLPHPQFF